MNLSLAKTASFALSFALLSPATSAVQVTTPDSKLSAMLRTHDEVLLKAVHTADRAAWRRLAAPDFFYLDETGGVTYLDEFIKQLEPMNSPPLAIQIYKLTRTGDTAIVLHEDTDQHQVRYIFTETWQRLNGTWRLRALHVTNVLSEPPAIALSDSQIDELTGSYQRGAVSYSISREGEKIIAQRSDRPEAEEMKAETRDMLFTRGGDPRDRIVFLRDATGKVTGFVVRYESSDVLWKKG